MVGVSDMKSSINPLPYALGGDRIALAGGPLEAETDQKLPKEHYGPKQVRTVGHY